MKALANARGPTLTLVAGQQFPFPLQLVRAPPSPPALNLKGNRAGVGRKRGDQPQARSREIREALNAVFVLFCGLLETIQKHFNRTVA